MIRLKALRYILNPKGQKGNSVPFNIEVIKSSTGEIVTGRCTCLGLDFKTDMIRLKFEGSNEVRNFHGSLIRSYNDEKVR